MDANPTPAPAPVPRRRWLRRTGIAVAVLAALAAGAYWYGGRETTLQTVMERIVRASGGQLTTRGVTGSLYGRMHIDRIEHRTPLRIIVARDVTIDWSPFQYFSGGVAINALHAANIHVQSLGTAPPSPMPKSLAAPFELHVDDARVTRLTYAQANATPVQVDDIRFKLAGGRTRWELRDASARTPWGALAANGTLGAQLPFKLDASASLAQAQPPAGRPAAKLALRASGSLALAQIDATGTAGQARGNAHLTLAPYDAVPLRALSVNASGVDPGLFNPALPRADMKVAVDARVDPATRSVRGTLRLDNEAEPGAIDHQRLPLRSVAGRLGGSLARLELEGMLIDLGAAGKFTGGGAIERGQASRGPGSAVFALRTNGIDLKAIHSKLRQTNIAGTIEVASEGAQQTVRAGLRDARLSLDAVARLEAGVLHLERALLAAGRSRVLLTGEAGISGNQSFAVDAAVSHFSPASFGDYMDADINANASARGTYAPAPAAEVAFTLRPSRLFDQPLSGNGKFRIDRERIANADAALALGRNNARIRGSFGRPSDRLEWNVDGRDLGALRAGMMGAVTASGVASGSFASPQTTFEARAQGLGWAKQARASDGVLAASGTARYDGAGRAVEVRAAGTASRFDPSAFGFALGGSINGGFDVTARTGEAWRAHANVNIKDSTLSGSPLWGHARFDADRRRISGADVELHVGANVAAARGGFGTAGERLDWRIDAPQLAALGKDYAGVLRGAGSLSGTMAAPSLAGSLEGASLRMAGQRIASLRASANLGSGRGAQDPLAIDVQAAGIESAGLSLAEARLQSSGTRGAHTLRASARGDTMDALAELRGGWDGAAWTGTIAALQNKGRYAFTLQAPAALRIGTAGGIASLVNPDSLQLGNAVIALPAGSVNLQMLDKSAARWRSTGSATGVPLTYLAQFSDAIRENMSGDLALGARWSVDMQAPPAQGVPPALAGSVHVFRERGDLVAGALVPVAMGLRTLDARAEVAGNSLRLQLELDGERAGRTRVDSTVQMIGGRVSRDSALRLSAQADMNSIAWLAPLARQPGLELDGALRMALSGAGTIGSPTLTGTISGDNLAARWPEQGVRLQRGVLRARMAGDQLLLEQLAFEGLEGRATATGNVRFAGGEATANLRLVADRLEVLSRPDRTVVVSGEAALLRTADQFSITGKFRANRARIELAPLERPTLSDDVIVLGRAKPAKASARRDGTPLNIDIEADLGNDFYLKGMGLDAQLAGVLNLRMTENRPPRITGTVRAINGTYAAYGQRLAIERGIITFSGPYDNPSLNIRAVRKRPEGEQLSATNVEAGVEVRGTALAPSARLVSTPNVPDSDKLSWLVLGHGMDQLEGQEAGVLSAAAGALLGGRGGGLQSRIANSLGVDELGLSQAKGLESTVLTVGKRISQRAYLSFEQGATSATSLVKLRYRLNERITLQVQTGANTAFDVLYSWAFD
ncbi:translocation/assembly module TamB domain-containing protein [Pseudoduganella sp. GCM10020061]|uniref:translocation/assembly module TamB domain-containing protein n=1 Tax=Pseudoduganella sp. GCM10020061 TaxID=3317345 RepID=UPI0036250621